MRGKRGAYKVWSGGHEGRRPLESVGFERMILKWVFRK
jgi:hypothetical protein